MGIINILDTHTTNLIAAGEVIERASSVVKELIENSIDAGATVINISLIDSGLTEICVSDNGIGMSVEDAKLCVLPHATSKIKNEKDLFRISTLGFRGEALPSIVSVSKFMLRTSSNGQDGISYILDGGKMISEALISMPRGCEIKVKNLFFNTPARLQNLSSPNIELSYITEYVDKIALSKPNIAFKLSNNNSTIYQTYGNNNLLEVIFSTYGVDVCKNMIEFSDSDGFFTVNGYTSKKDISRSSKKEITIIINNRVVKNNQLTNAVLKGYGNRLMIGKYPISIINISCDFSLVDVNVHPSKKEVRFSNENELALLITNAISFSLSNNDFIVGVENESDNKNAIVLNEKIDVLKEDLTEYNTFNDEYVTETLDYDNNFEEDYSLFETKTPFIENIEVEKQNETSPIDEYSYQQFTFNNNEVKINNESSKLSKLYYVGQLFGTYILTQNEEGLFIIDQHAALERINYEKIKKELKKETVNISELIIPLKLTYKVSDFIVIREKLDLISKLGLELEEFGNDTFILRRIPTWIFKGQEEDFVREIIDNIVNNRKNTKEKFLDSMAKNLACKKSIKANHYISSNEVTSILYDLERCDNPFNCPHGRPTIIKYTKEDIEKWFKRIV